jgi:hypothetical protein
MFDNHNRRAGAVIVPVIFTYGKDGACAIEAAGALRDVGFDFVVVFEDMHHPVTDECRKALCKLAYVCQSDHPNPGGQFGIECLRGIVDCHLQVDSAYVLKVDSDTIVRRVGRIKQAAVDGVAAAAWTWHGWEFSGCCALISRKTLLHAQKLLANPPAWIGERCPEDITIGRIAEEVGEVRRFPYNAEGGFAAGYRYGKTTLEEYARRFDVVTFGNRHLLPGRDCDKREKVAFTMSRFRRISLDGE